MPFVSRPYRYGLWLWGILLAGMLLFQHPAWAQSVQDWQSPRQQQASWISDRANLIPWVTEQHLNRRINQLWGRTRAEIAIATLPQLPTNSSAHGFALDLFNTWGIGNRDTNNGVLLLVSSTDRHIEIITGTGLQAILPDVAVRQLIQREIVPAFQQQDYATGIQQGTTAIAQRLEAQLPSRLVPRWLPKGIVWIPWLIALGGIGLGITGTVQAIRFSLTRVQVPVPSQGFNAQTFAASSDQLAAYPFPQLLAKLFTPNERDWEQEIPEQPLSYVWVGGALLGMGLIQGFWQFVLMHPEAEFWQRDAVAWGICALGSSAGLIWGALVGSRFVIQERRWSSLRWNLIVIVLMGSLGGYIWVYRIPQWVLLVVLTLVGVMVGWVAWRISVDDDLKFKRQRDYRCDRTGAPVQELTPPELEQMLRPDEMLAQSMGKVEFRGWRAADLALPLDRTHVYLVRRSDYTARSCDHCQSLAVETSTRTVERTIQTTKRINRKRKETTTSVVAVPQMVYTCRSCGHEAAYDQPAQVISGSDGSSYASSTDTSSGYGGSSGYDSSPYDSTATPDYSNSSGSDFGGGSSEGGGAGSDW